MFDFKKFSDRVWANKVAKGFNTTDVEQEFVFIYGELAEMYEAYRKNKSDLGGEFADVLMYLMGLAHMLGVDLEAELEKKMAKNEQREYKQIGKGFVRTKEVE